MHGFRGLIQSFILEKRLRVQPLTFSVECASVVGAITPTREYQDFRYMGQSESPPAWLPNTDKKHPTPSSQEATSAVGMQVNHLSNGSMLRTPFRDCLGTYGNFKLHTFHKPDDGYIDSYIKVKWSRRQQQLSYKTPMLQSGPLLLTSSRVLSIFDHDRAVVTLFNAGENEAIASPLGAPRLLPAHFGQLAKMEPRERRLWDFCKFSPSSS